MTFWLFLNFPVLASIQLYSTFSFDIFNIELNKEMF